METFAAVFGLYDTLSSLSTFKEKTVIYLGSNF